MPRCHSLFLTAPLLGLGVSGGLALGGGGALPPTRVEIRPGEVRLLRGSQVLRSYPVPEGHTAQALVAGGQLALTTEPEGRWDGFQLRIYDVATGRLFARQTQVGRVSRLYTKGDTLFAEYASAVAQIATRTLTQNLRVAGQTNTIDGWRVAENVRSRSPSPSPSPPAPAAACPKRTARATRERRTRPARSWRRGTTGAESSKPASTGPGTPRPGLWSGP